MNEILALERQAQALELKQYHYDLHFRPIPKSTHRKVFGSGIQLEHAQVLFDVIYRALELRKKIERQSLLTAEASDVLAPWLALTHPSTALRISVVAYIVQVTLLAQVQLGCCK